MYKREIEDLKSSIASARQAIKSTRENMARQRTNKAPKHYQESGKRNIENQKKIIEGYNKEIANYREKKKKMGKATDSFKREIGKNTGKWVSNKVFGDGHSTPHRVDVNRTEGQYKSENKESLLSKGKDFFSDVYEEDLEEKEQIKKFNSKKEDVIATYIPNNADEIMNFVNLMLSTIKSNGWKAGNNEEHINLLSDACLTKLEQCVIKLKSMNEIHQAEYVDTEIIKLKKKKKFQKYALWVGIVLFFLVGFILYKLEILK
ncbi:hypothetical protein [Lacinutrix mariniflava]|uniref:hypothetical protein n=1 Tax=Lacinutrix mariniflava TaxID=342955 RepID=UPI0006E3C61E|nr:hypothetical protein [Lacinutrix mariniflava]